MDEKGLAVGRKVALKIKMGPCTKKVKRKKGTIVGVYDRHFMVDLGRYRECFLLTDLKVGRIVIESLK